jgi:hypothetical protein
MSRICPFGVLAVCALAVVAGCGDGHWTATAPGDVPLTISVVADTPGTISSVTLATGRADTLDVTDASARIERADGTSRNVALANNITRNIVTFGEARVTPSGADVATSDAAADGSAQADVPFLAEIATGPPDQLASATVTALETGDTFDIAGATAKLERWNGASEPVAMSANAEGTVITLGPAALSPDPGQVWSRFYALVIDGPIVARDGPTATATEIGSLAFFFWVDLNGTLSVPSTIRASIPTLGCARDARVVIDGLTPREDTAWTVITDKDGGRVYSRWYAADASGQIVIPDSKLQITAEMLSGPRSRIELHFVNWWKTIAPPAPVGPDPHHRGQLNVLVVNGPIRIRNGITERTTEIGRLRLGFEVLADGTVIAPGHVKLNVPTNGTVGDPRVVVTGLEAGDFARTSVIDTGGARSQSRIHVADPSGAAAVPQALKGITAGRLSGPQSQIILLFARTDADRDGYPDVF